MNGFFEDYKLQRFLSNCVTKINIEHADTAENLGGGTGFFYASDFYGLGGNHKVSLYLLISNKHVFKNPKHTIKFKINKAEHNANERTTFELSQSNFLDMYFPHPEEDVDLACINILSLLRKNNIDFKSTLFQCVVKQMMDDIDPKKFTTCSRVIFAGYPLGIYDQVNNLPLIRDGSVATIPSVNYQGRGEFLIDAQVFEGSSGSPVFASIGGQVYLAGIISETMTRRDIFQEIVGLGIVIKQNRIKEMINVVIAHTLLKNGFSSDDVNKSLYKI